MSFSGELVSQEQQSKAQLLLQLRHRGVSDLRVLRAVEQVPREDFVPHRYRDLANRDLSIPTACGQLIHAPLLIARMIAALCPGSSHRILEIGTGSGYATAILAKLCQQVVSIDRFESLVASAKLRLERLNFDNVSLHLADALHLSEEFDRFDRIIVHAQLDPILPKILRRLTPGGLIVGAIGGVGPAPHYPWVLRIHLDDTQELKSEQLFQSRMRPLIPGLSHFV